MKKTVRILCLILALVMCVGLMSCKSNENDATNDSDSATATQPSDDDEVTMKVAALKGPTGMGMAKLMQDYSGVYEFTLASAPTDITASVIKGEYDIAAVPINLAATLYKKTNKAYSLAAINTLGVLYVLESGNTVNSVEDLRGKTIYATGQGSTPEYILDYVLSKNGIDPDKDVTIDYKTEHSELTALLAADKAAIGVLPEPNVTTAMSKNENLRVALDLTEEWKKISPDSEVMQGCIIVKNEFAENHPEALEKFLSRYEQSVEFVNSDSSAAELIAEKEIVPSSAIAEKTLPRCNIVFIRAEEAKDKLNGFLNVLYTANPQSVGGEMPDEDFIYKK